MLLKYAVVPILAIVTLVMNFGGKRIAAALYKKSEPLPGEINRIKFAALILSIFTFALALLLF